MKSESSHATNLSNFEKVIANCSSFGPRFQPSKSTIQLTSMQQLLNEARACLFAVTERLTIYNICKNARILAFADLPTLTSRIINALAATDASPKTRADARSIAGKIKGIRVGKRENVSSKTESTATTLPLDDNSPFDSVSSTTNGKSASARTHSSAHTSRDQQIEYFSRLLLLLQNEMYYQPNEQDLQVQSLQMYLETMRMTHSAMMVQEAELSAVRLLRDEKLYGNNTGIYDVARDTKQYVKSAFGLSSPQYKQLSKLKFSKPR